MYSLSSQAGHSTVLSMGLELFTAFKRHSTVQYQKINMNFEKSHHLLQQEMTTRLIYHCTNNYYHMKEANCNRCIYKNSYSQNASVVLLLVYLVNNIFDEDTEVFHSMVVNNVTHIRNQNRLLDPVLKIHQESENKKRPLSRNMLDFAGKMFDQIKTVSYLSLAFMTSSMLENRKCMSDWLRVLIKTGLRRK